MEDRIILTKDGYKKLKKELEKLKTVERKKIAKMLEEARSHGDFRENAEYDVAKDKQAHIETRILQLEKLLKEAEIHDESNNEHGVVCVGSLVTIKNKKTGEECVYKLVGHGEADPSSGSISIASPVGKALLGKRVGETVNVETPSGKTQISILGVRS